VFALLVATPSIWPLVILRVRFRFPAVWVGLFGTPSGLRLSATWQSVQKMRSAGQPLWVVSEISLRDGV